MMQSIGENLPEENGDREMIKQMLGLIMQNRHDPLAIEQLIQQFNEYLGQAGMKNVEYYIKKADDEHQLTSTST